MRTRDSRTQSMAFPAICNNTNKIFDAGRVEVVARYADCSVFKCPACSQNHDDRRDIYSRNPDARNGFIYI